MNTELVSGPGRYPVTLAEAKKQVEVPTSDTSHDNYLKFLIAQATTMAESFTGRKLVYQTQKLYLQNWPSKSFIEIPFGQLKSVTHIKHTDIDGDQSTWDATNYIVRTGDYGYVALAYGISWPTDQLYYVNPIEIQFVCGYYSGDEWSDEATISEGEIVVPTGYASQFAYEAGGDGTTDVAEPAWPALIGGTVVDNDVTWTNIGEAVPFNIRGGILIAIADLFTQRESFVQGVSHKNLKRFEAMLYLSKVWK